MHNCNKYQCSFLSPLFYIFINRDNYYKLYYNFSRPQIIIPWAKIQFIPPNVCINNVLLKALPILGFLVFFCIFDMVSWLECLVLSIDAPFRQSSKVSSNCIICLG